jgi:hypothetical protein
MADLNDAKVCLLDAAFGMRTAETDRVTLRHCPWNQWKSVHMHQPG